MKRSALLWILSVIITLASAYYQRVTGPTYPVSGRVSLGGREFKYRLERSSGEAGDQPIGIATRDPSVKGTLEWRRYKTSDDWTANAMEYRDGALSANLPHQPPAGKLEYRITLDRGGERAAIPAEGPAVIRFKGSVPVAVLILHVVVIFGAMLLSTRTGLEFFNKEAKLKRLMFWTLCFLAVGGLVLGPVVQKYAFGAFWTGWPLGTDLTDNKTAAALIGWIIAAVAIYKFRNPKAWALGAAVLTVVVYLIPHSLLGSELDYGKTIKPVKPGLQKVREDTTLENSVVKEGHDLDEVKRRADVRVRRPRARLRQERCGPSSTSVGPAEGDCREGYHARLPGGTS